MTKVIETKKWVDFKGTFQYADIPNVYDKLPIGIYELNFSDMGGFYLTKIADKFELPEKIYAMERPLIDRIKTSFAGFNKNFGVLLKGLKGTGKTITAKQLANEIQLPTILVNKYFADIGGFINGIQQDLILVFDEFEKVYEFNNWSSDDDQDEEGKSKKTISNLLTLMDGVFTSTYKRLFVLTTNKSFLPDAIMARPSRIRYVKDFTDLKYEAILEIFTDVVKNKKLIPELMKLIRDYEILTTDIIKSIAEEANLYDTADPEFYEIFNVKRSEKSMDLFKVDIKTGKETLVTESYNPPFHTYKIGKRVCVYDKYIDLTEFNDEENTLVGVKKDSSGKDIGQVMFKFKPHVFTHKNLELAF